MPTFKLVIRLFSLHFDLQKLKLMILYLLIHVELHYLQKLTRAEGFRQ